MLSDNLRKYVDIYIKRIYEFFDFKNSIYELRNALRHIEIVRVQMLDDLNHVKSSMSDEDLEFIYSILSDSVYFEGMKHESEEWRVGILKITWNRLIMTMEYPPLDESKTSINNDIFVDSKTRRDGRHIYEMYQG